MALERKSGAGRDVELYTCPRSSDEVVLFDVYAAGLSDWGRGCSLERSCSSICGLELVLDGSGRISAGGRSLDLRPGDVFVLHFNERHAYGAGECDHWRKIWFSFRHSFIMEAMLHLGLLTVSRVRPPSSEREWLEGAFRDILRLLKEQPKGYHLRASATAYELLLRLAQWAGAPSGRDAMPPSLTRAILYARGHLGSGLTIGDLASHAFCSRVHLNRLFRRHLGVSTSEWLRSFRMGEAENLLTTTDVPIKSVAARVGYSDPLHFSAAFRKATSMSPSVYRARHQRPRGRAGRAARPSEPGRVLPG